MGWGQRRWDPHGPLRTRGSSSPSLPWGQASPGHLWIPGEGEKGIREMQHRGGGCSTPKGGHRAELGGSNSRARPAALPPAAPARPAATRGSAPYRAHGGSVGSPPCTPAPYLLALGTGGAGDGLGHRGERRQVRGGSAASRCSGKSRGEPCAHLPRGSGVPWFPFGAGRARRSRHTLAQSRQPSARAQPRRAGRGLPGLVTILPGIPGSPSFPETPARPGTPGLPLSPCGWHGGDMGLRATPQPPQLWGEGWGRHAHHLSWQPGGTRRTL